MAGILMMTVCLARSPAQGVRAWLDTAPIPTYYEAPPETTPTFEPLFGVNAVYPYTARPNGGEKAASRRWSKISKTAVPDVSSEDYAFPLLAALRLNTDTAKSAAEAAVLKLRGPDAKANASSKDVLRWNEGLLLRELGKEDEAMALFEAGLKGAASAWMQYLNLLAIEQR
jgi:hypothetical protein